MNSRLKFLKFGNQKFLTDRDCSIAPRCKQIRIQKKTCKFNLWLSNQTSQNPFRIENLPTSFDRPKFFWEGYTMLQSVPEACPFLQLDWSIHCNRFQWCKQGITSTQHPTNKSQCFQSQFLSPNLAALKTITSARTCRRLIADWMIETSSFYVLVFPIATPGSFHIFRFEFISRHQCLQEIQTGTGLPQNALQPGRLHQLRWQCQCVKTGASSAIFGHKCSDEQESWSSDAAENQPQERRVSNWHARILRSRYSESKRKTSHLLILRILSLVKKRMTHTFMEQAQFKS